MAYLPCPLTTSTDTGTTAISALLPSPLFHRASHVSIVKIRNRNHRFGHSKMSCNSTNCDPNSDSTSNNGETSLGKLDRRKVLLGIGGMYGAAGGLGATEPLAVGAPIQAPDVTNLRYQDQDIPIPWLKTRPQPKTKTTTKSSKSGVAKAAELPTTTIISSGDFPKPLNSIIRAEVPRPKKSRSKDEKEDEEEVLLIKGIELERNNFVKFDVYINDEDYSVTTPANSEFAGSFVNVPHKQIRGIKTKTSLRLAMNELLEDLGAEDDDSVIVTLVPRAGTDVTIGGIDIEYVSG